MERVFLDTNLLVYADDLDAADKGEVARELLAVHLRSATGVVSTQVLQEYFVIATRKLGVDPAIARRKVELISRLDVVELRTELILGAIDLHRLHSLSFWDALIVKAASVAGCARLLSEDMQDGATVEGVRITNPFPA
jgi:predicted nucleic acid-binding protein